jgi:3-hydroxyisobutyrate dehydrogenase-like beta-hydroxyacid dehydrogenase
MFVRVHILSIGKEVHMSTNPSKRHRRQDHEMAKMVQCGLSLLYLAGVAEACQYMVRAGISSSIIERIVSARNVRGAKTPVRVQVSRSS